MTAKLLIVEDIESLALLLRYNFEAEGYLVSVAERGDEAELLASSFVQSRAGGYGGASGSSASGRSARAI
jgi:hypothetical protein